MNITEMIGISLRTVLRCFHDLMFFVVLRNEEFLIPINSLVQIKSCHLSDTKPLSGPMLTSCYVDLYPHTLRKLRQLLKMLAH